MPDDQVERRKDLRVEVHPDKLQVTVGVPGNAANGVVLDISRSGMKVSLQHDVPEPLIGGDCLVFFVEDPQGRVSEKAKPGKLVRMEVLGQYAIEFDRPLEVLNIGGDSEAVESESERQATTTDSVEQPVRR